MVIDPPEGNMAAYLHTLEQLAARPLTWVAPGHGFLMGNPSALFRSVIHHRKGRESRIIAALMSQKHATIESLVPMAYADTPEPLWPLARRSLLAHLLHLRESGAVTQEGDRWTMTSSLHP